MDKQRQKIDIIFFSRDARVIADEVVSEKGELYLEKRPMGKWLCYKKGNLLKAIKLTKKSYKNLIRFTCGIRMERYYDLDDMEYDEHVTDNLIKQVEDYSYGKVKQVYFPAKPKEKAPFIIEIFRWIKT